MQKCNMQCIVNEMTLRVGLLLVLNLSLYSAFYAEKLHCSVQLAHIGQHNSSYVSSFLNSTGRIFALGLSAVQYFRRQIIHIDEKVLPA
ncbi:unnamed protein product [Allacma fusca]|uniref:Uncharacterized protein n=1 Tax=Allacma fusca TaxID=39272 RepID=A0A8J2MAA2_9HEXA|nr:unnamed protein product [Allacma fusca]